MNRFFKNLNIFLAQNIYFSKKKFEKLNIFDRNLWNFSKDYLKIFKFYETYKSREIFGEFPDLVEKFSVAAKGIFSGERSGHLNSIKRPPQGVRGAKAPRTVAKFHFLKRFKVFENEFISQKCQHFSSTKYPFFEEKFRKIEYILQEFLNYLRKIILNFHFLWHPINPEKFSVNSNI